MEKSQTSVKQCNYATSRTDKLRAHLEMHRGEKSNKCDQCAYATSWAWNLRAHLKTHMTQGRIAKQMKPVEKAFKKSQTNAISVGLHPLGETIQ